MSEARAQMAAVKSVCAVRRIKKVFLIAAGIVAFLAVTGAAPGPDASRAQLIAYSLGSAAAIIVAIRIVIKLFVYIVQAMVVIAACTALLALAKITVNAIAGG
jgi:hypothetical protein